MQCWAAFFVAGLFATPLLAESALPSTCASPKAQSESALLQTHVSRVRVAEAAMIEESDFSGTLTYISLRSTGSSILTSILQRFCDAHGRTCGILSADSPTPMNSSSMDLGHVEEFAATAKHAASSDVFPAKVVLAPAMTTPVTPDSFKIAMFQQPYDRLMSSYRSSNASAAVSLLGMLKNGTETFDCGTVGAPMSELLNETQVRELDFVLLSEEYDRSLMMLRRRLGWSMLDMMYYRVPQPEPDEDLQEALEAMDTHFHKRLGNLNSATINFLRYCAGGNETRVYARANERFWQQWQNLTVEQRHDVETDLVQFQAARQQLQQCCSEHSADAYCQQLLEDPETVMSFRDVLNGTELLQRVYRKLSPSSCLSAVKGQMPEGN